MYKAILTIYAGDDPRAAVTVMRETSEKLWIEDYWGRKIPTTPDTYLLDAHDVSKQYAEHFKV